MYINEARVKELMAKLKLTRDEAIELISYDEDVNKDKPTEHDLTPEQKRNVQDIMRKTDHRKSSPHSIKHRPNELKEALIVALANFLENECEFMLSEEVTYCDAVTITNANRMIHFAVGEKEFDLQLIEKRPPKK